MEIKEFIENNKERIKEELEEFVSFKSISTEPETFKEDMNKVRKFLKKQLESLGCNVEEIATQGLPIVYGELIKDPKYKTVLVYGHYDVQPAEKEDGWEQEDPFKMVEKDGKWYARGIADNKGPIFSVIKAVEYLSNNDLKINIKFFIEGEEEIGSPTLGNVIFENKEKLSCDLVLASDGNWSTNETPCVEYALRGMAYFFVRIEGPKHDVHSGTYGGGLKNPHIQLINLLSKCVDDNGHVKIPGFYEDVRSISEKELKMIQENPLDLEVWKKEIGGKLTSQDKDEILKRIGFTPTFEIHGITGGYTGEGSKTIVPSYAEAKISCRLVADQEGKNTYELVANFLRENHPGVKIKLEAYASPFFMDPEDEDLEIARKLLEETYSMKTIFDRAGGSVPATVELQRELGKVVMPNVNRPDCGMHTSHENTYVENYWKSIEFFVKYLRKIS